MATNTDFSITIPLNNATYNTNQAYYIGDSTSPANTLYNGSPKPAYLSNLSYTLNFTSYTVTTNGSNSYLNSSLTTPNMYGNIVLNFGFQPNYTLNISLISIFSTSSTVATSTPSFAMTMKDANGNPIYNSSETGQTTNSTVFVNSNSVNTFINNGTQGTVNTLIQKTNGTSSIKNGTNVINAAPDYVYYCYDAQNAFSLPSTNVFSGVSSGKIIYGVNATGSNTTIYSANLQIFGTLVYTPPPSPPIPQSTALPISNICFVGNTPIETDQGIIPVSQLSAESNTIYGNPIRAITRTIYEDDYLLCIHKDAFADNYPIRDVILSKEHKIMIPPLEKLHPQIREFFSTGFGRILSANQIFTIFEKMPERLRKIRQVPYHGEALYNILLDKRGWVVANNMICETLDPDNIIAKLYLSNLGTEYKDRIVYMMNECIKRRDVNALKRIAERVFPTVYTSSKVQPLNEIEDFSQTQSKSVVSFVYQPPDLLDSDFEEAEEEEAEEVIIENPMILIQNYNQRFMEEPIKQISSFQKPAASINPVAPIKPAASINQVAPIKPGGLVPPSAAEENILYDPIHPFSVFRSRRRPLL